MDTSLGHVAKTLETLTIGFESFADDSVATDPASGAGPVAKDEAKRAREEAKRAVNEAKRLRDAEIAAQHEVLGQKRVTDSCGALLTAVRNLSGHEDALIVLAFDESHILHKVLDTSEITVPHNTRYTTLCWALDLLGDTKGVFSLFLSTNSHLAKFAPIPSLFPSARLNANAANHLQAPYTELPFDCFPTGPIASQALSLLETNALSHLCQFGRPLSVFRLFDPTNLR